MTDMSKIGPSKNTKPERLVYMRLVRARISHRRNFRPLPGCPDVWIPKANLAVFIDGRFWHDPNGPTRRMSEFWITKVRNNRRRDLRNRRRLSRMSVSFITIWDDRIIQGLVRLSKKLSRDL